MAAAVFNLCSFNTLLHSNSQNNNFYESTPVYNFSYSFF
jgi:hypothetical protein